MAQKSHGRYWLGGKRKAEQDLFFEQALKAAHWRPGDAEHWDACWYTGMPDVARFLDAGPDRKINHIPGNSALTLKNRLYETLSAVRERQKVQYRPDHEHVARLDFVPRVYSMPEDYETLQQTALDNPDLRWILKPKNSSRGRGVRVLRDVADVPLEDKFRPAAPHRATAGTGAGGERLKLSLPAESEVASRLRRSGA